MLKPQLIIGGASKSGTTALYFYLRQHPAICMSDKKELHFFSFKWLNQYKSGPGDKFVVAEIPRNFDKYLTYFNHCDSGKVIVDISPSYLFHHKSSEIIKKHLGKTTKVIFILRNPVDKAFSQYIHLINAGRESLSFIEALSQESKREQQGYSDMWLYKKSGFYAKAIQGFIETLGEEHIRVFFHEELLNNPEFVLQEICKFTNIDSEYKFRTVNNANRSGSPKSLLLSKLIAPNIFTYLIRRILPKGLGRVIRNKLKDINTGIKPEMPNELRNSLLKEYEVDIEIVEQLVGRPSGWLV